MICSARYYNSYTTYSLIRCVLYIGGGRIVYCIILLCLGVVVGSSLWKVIEVCDKARPTRTEQQR